MTPRTAGGEPHDPIHTLALACAAAALEKKASDVAVLDVRELTSLADYFVIASGRSDTQVRAIAEAVEEALRERGRRPIAVEGLRHGQWVLVDYGDVVVHVFYRPVREHYDLERLWSQAPRLVVDEGTPGRVAGDGREAAR